MRNRNITNLSGGINVGSNPVILQDTEFDLVVNYKLDTVGSLTKRNGYATFADQTTDGKTILGLYQYTNTGTPAETTQLMVANNSGNTQSVIYYNNSGTWTLSKNDTVVLDANITNFNRWRFATFIDYVFRVNGVQVVADSNNVNAPSWGTTNTPATITPSFIAVFEDRVYVARNGTSEGSRFYFSSLPSSGAITWDTTNDWVDVNPDDGDEITALENSGNRLLIFKNRSLYRWSFGQVEPDRLIGVGTESQECVKTNLDVGITFFANNNGVYGYTGSRPKLISRKIQPWIDAVPAGDWDAVCAEIDRDHYFLYLSDSLTVDGTTYTNVMAVYTISLDAWTVYTLHTPWRFANKFINSGAEGIYFGSNTGRAYQWDTGLTDDSGGAAEDTAIPVSAQAITKEHLFNYPGDANIEYFDVISQNAFLTQVSYQFNRDKDFIPIGTLKERYWSSRHIGKKANSVRLQFTDNAPVASRIDGYNFGYNLRQIKNA